MLNRRAALAASALVIASLQMPAQAQNREIRALSGFDSNFVFTREIAKPFMENVTKATGGAMTFKFNGPETVPIFEQFQPTAAGAFDLLFTHPAYHSGTTTVGLATDAIDYDPVKRRDSGVWAFVDAHYQKAGLKLIAMTPTGSKGFQYVLKRPITSAKSFEGMKIRGTVSYHPMIRAMGGAPVVMGGGDVYSALERGIIDGAAWGLTGVADFKWNEVAKYLARPVFGQVSLLIVMNKRAFEALPAAQQQALLDEGRKLELSTVTRFDTLAADELKLLKSKGMQETAFAPSDAASLEKLWNDGVWEVATAKSEDAKALKQLALDKGMTR
jgi:TRAP-type C4-dicarboxylate transport system substrate-binding protein